MSEQQIELPALEHGFVKGRFVLAKADSLDDEDRYPDLFAEEGQVRITPQHVIHLTEGPEPATVEKRVIMAEIDERGYMVDVTSKSDSEREPGMWLAIGRYNVELMFAGMRRNRSFGIEVKPEHTKESPLHLTLAEPQTSVPGTTEVTRIIDRQLAQLAATEAKGFRDEAEGFRDEAQLATQGADAYEVAVQQGYEGTREEWLESLVGPMPTQLATTTEPGLLSTTDKRRVEALNLVSVTEHGAIGDGVSNDFTAVQAAINATPEHHTLRLPDGLTFNLADSGPLQVSHPMTIDGGHFLVENKGAISVTSSDVTIQNLLVDDIENPEEWPGQIATVDFWGEPTARITNVHAYNIRVNKGVDRSIRMRWVENFSIQRCRVHNFAYAGIWVSSGNSGTIRRNRVTDPLPYADLSSGPYCIAASDTETTEESRSNGIAMSENYVRGGRVGLDTHGGKNVQFINNRVLDCYRGITMVTGNDHRATGPENIIATGNLIDGGEAGETGFRVGGVPVTSEHYPAPTSVIITHNNIRNVVEPFGMFESRPIDRSKSIIRDNVIEVETTWQDPVMRLDTSVGKAVYFGSELISYDSGWRDVTSLGAPANLQEGSYIHVRRLGNELHIALRFLFVSEPEDTFLNRNLLTGFRPMAQVFLDGGQGTPGVLQRLRFYENGSLQWINGFSYGSGSTISSPPSGGSFVNGTFVIAAAPDMPTSLVGTAV